MTEYESCVVTCMTGGPLYNVRGYTDCKEIFRLHINPTVTGCITTGEMNCCYEKV